MDRHERALFRYCIASLPVLPTDLYALAMLQAYFEEHMSDVAVFSLFVRRSRELAASGDTSTARVMGRALTRR